MLVFHYIIPHHYNNMQNQTHAECDVLLASCNFMAS